MSDGSHALNRRGMLKLGGVAAGLLVGARAAARPYAPPTPVDTGEVSKKGVRFPAWRGSVDPASAPPRSPLPPEQRVGFALVGLGRLSLEELLPAFAECQKARPVALVSGTPEKLRAVAAQYGISSHGCYDYAGFDRIRDDPAIRAVYVVLPNAMHREYTERAAAAGKHVLCEKPMATSAEDARAMIAACERAKVKLMVAYRIQYQPHNLRAMRFVRDHTYGRALALHAVNVQTVAANGAQQWRHKRAMAGGGSLPDIGLYCLNTARFLTGEEPIEVFARTDSPAPAKDARYAEVEETVSFMLRFPSGFVANCFTSYGARDDKYQRLTCYGATLEMPNAYKYAGQQLFVSRNIDDMDQRSEIVLPRKNQFAEELDHFAECILQNERPRTPGEEGLQDQVIMEAIYESAKRGQPVALQRYDKLDMFRVLPPK